MKKAITIVILLLTAGSMLPQNPVAVNDTATGIIGKYLTINVLENDSSPSGEQIRILNALDAYSHTDSTITYSFNYDKFFKESVNQKYWHAYYSIIDEGGSTGLESQGVVCISLNNHRLFDTLDLNNIRTLINPTNNQFWDLDAINFYQYPKDSLTNTIFNQALWLGGIDQEEKLRFAGERYQQAGIDFWPGPISIGGNNLSVDTSTAVQYLRVWKLSKDEIIYHKTHYSDPGYEPIDNIRDWPAHGDESLNQSRYLAPFIDIDGDSIYNPYAGDYPLIRGDQCIFYISNDYREHTESGGEKIGLEIHGMAYEFNMSATNPMANTVFLSYKIFNRSNEALNDTYIGLLCDFDIGYPRDDYVGCDVGRGAYYGYNGDGYDENHNGITDTTGGYGYNPPAQGIVILGGPYLDPNEKDDPADQCDESITGVGFGDGVVDNERYGMTKFIYFNNSAGIQGDPQTAEEYYDYMNAIWRDGTAMEYGGNGHISSGAFGPACNFMYPGLSDPCYWGTGGEEPYGPVDWTEDIAGNDPGDRRGLSVMGPFTFESHSMEKVDLAFVTARGDDGPLSSVALLKEYIDLVKDAYFEDPDYFGYQWLGEKENKTEKQSLRVYPNPAIDKIWIDIQAEGKTFEYSIFDSFGRMVQQGELTTTGKTGLSIGGLNEGIYILSIKDQDKIYTGKILKK
jgi:hypothetical protein